ncbi:hypothetical protein NM688_g5843 [Phlebia brevispora]|uniref:Uncharacterized protein n=1 Tax=Phlebia brevispora TaxID=194682 RepID=A0ACC1SP86_9APHY|nr:hypothetical protein NM688_g5843 [Phlebia brevispora]
MEDPAREIGKIITLLTTTPSPDVQKAAILKYFAPDAALRHPLCIVDGGPGSRDVLVHVFQWYRIVSPRLEMDIRNTTFNPSTNELFVEVVQVFHNRWSPFRAAPARVLIHLVLCSSAEDPKLCQIAVQEDWYHPTDVAALTFPPVVPVVRFLLKFGTVASVINARAVEMAGLWITPSSKGKGVDTSQSQGSAEARPSSYVEPDVDTSGDAQKSKTE